MGKVLVVDDSLMVRQQVKRALALAGLDVVEAKDGIDALERMSGAADVSLVICDVNMPRMAGLDLVEALRKDPRYASLPVVMLTTEAQKNLLERSRALGVKGWIMKPFKPDLLAAAAKKLA